MHDIKKSTYIYSVFLFKNDHGSLFNVHLHSIAGVFKFILNNKILPLFEAIK